MQSRPVVTSLLWRGMRINAYVTRHEQRRVLYVSMPAADDRALPVLAVCRRCGSAADTGRTVERSSLPLTMNGRWRCSLCGGDCRLPDDYFIVDRGDRDVVIELRTSRKVASWSAITLAQLVALGDAAQAVQQGEPEAEARLERALSQAPEPIRRLRDRFALRGWTREQKLMLAGVIVGLVAALVPLLKNDGGVTEERLVEIIERMVEQQSEPASRQGQPEHETEDRAGSAGTEKRGTPTNTLQSDGRGRAPEVQDGQGIDGPDQ